MSAFISALMSIFTLPAAIYVIFSIEKVRFESFGSKNRVDLSLLTAAPHEAEISEWNLLLFPGWCRIQSGTSDSNDKTWKPGC